jgi:hypothetical protein
VIRAIVWKEMREQGVIAVALAVLGGGLLVAAATYADPPTPGASASDLVASLGLGRMLTLMLVVTAGMVCGGALFAAEREAGTMSFLEALPAARWSLWVSKLAAGLLLSGAQVGLLLGAAAVLELADGPFMSRLVVYALLAFAWGVLGSTLARTTLGSVGIAIPAATLATFLFLLPITVMFSGRSSTVPRPLGWLLFEALMFVTPLALSAWRFTALDRKRAAEAVLRVNPGAGGAAVRSRRPGWGLRALVWLSLRQIRLTGLVLSAFALVFGSSLLLPELRPLLVWPPLALMLGVLVGVCAFGDEQSHRSAIFWGEFRLPVGRAWCVRIVAHLTLLAWLLLLLALPCIIRAQLASSQKFGYGQTTLAVIFQSRIFDELGSQGWKYLLAPAAYGFAFGHLCGLLFRKLVVACGVAVMLAGVAAAAWGPSLLAGGLRHWQLWLPVAIALLTGRLLMRPWAGDRAGARASLARAGLGMGLVAAATGAGLISRVVQVPLHDDTAADTAYVASLPTYDENLAGREFRMATERFARALAASQDRAPPGTRRLTALEDQVERAARSGWKMNEEADLGPALDQLYAVPPPNPEEKSWPELAEIAAHKPPGVYDPPHLVSSPAASAQALDNARKMATVMLARGLQLQANGNQALALADPLRAALALLPAVPAPLGPLSLEAGQSVAAEAHLGGLRDQSRANRARFVADFRIVLMLARTVRTGGGIYALDASQDIERLALRAADRWLERLARDQADDVRALTRFLAAYDDGRPFDLRSHVLVERFIVRGMMQAPGQWLAPALRGAGDPPDQNPAEAELVAVAWTVPWERERTRRLVGLAIESLRPDAEGYLTGRPGGLILQGRTRLGDDPANRELLVLVIRRSILLKAAICAYQAENGAAPPTQAELQQRGYVADVPHDPFTQGRPFGYRVSAGEELVAPMRFGPGNRALDPPYRVAVKPGQVVIWSVGPDRVDQGGKIPPDAQRAEDLVYLVPAPVAR